MKFPTAIRSLAFALLLGVTTIGLANAQAAVSDDKIHAFLTAAMSVNKVIEQWTPRIEGAESQEAADELLAQANAELVAVIEGTDGISPDEYKQIAEAARTDPALNARIQEIFEQRFRQ